MRNYITAFSILASILIFSCNFINPKEELPTYIHLENPAIVDKNNNPLSSNISTAWVYLESSTEVKMLGVYTLPTTFPAFINEKGKIQIFYGINADGLYSNTTIYPYYKVVKQDVDKKPLQTMCEETGGRFFLPKNENEYDQAFRQIEDDLRQQYILSYSPSNDAQDGSFRNITVKLNRKDSKELKVLCRRGYYAKKGA